MYERFTDRARKVMALANQEARGLHHEYLGTEHILLGLLRETASVAALVLQDLGVSLETAQIECGKLVKAGPEISLPAKLPQTPRAKQVVHFAIEEARELFHNHVGTEHLLLGLVKESEGIGAKVLQMQGLELDQIRQAVLKRLQSGPLPQRFVLGDEAENRTLIAWLANRNVPCPGCGYNLRGLREPRCPECGSALALSVSIVDPYLKAWATAAACACAMGGIGLLFVVLLVKEGWPGPPPGSPGALAMEIMIPISLAMIPISATLLSARRRFLRRDRGVQWTIAILSACLLAIVLSCVAFIQ